MVCHFFGTLAECRDEVCTCLERTIKEKKKQEMKHTLDMLAREDEFNSAHTHREGKGW